MTSFPPQFRTASTAARWFRVILFCLVALGFSAAASFTALAQEAAGFGRRRPQAHEGLTPNAPLIDLGPFKVTNSMVYTWIVALAIIIFAQYAMRNVKEVPEGAQNFWEWLVEGLYNLLESIIGHDLVKKTFWFFATVFIFILFTNWAGLIPGVGTIGWGQQSEQGGVFEVTRPLFRGVNADLNMTMAMAALFFVCWFVWALQANGFGGFILHIFGPKGATRQQAS